MTMQQGAFPFTPKAPGPIRERPSASISTQACDDCNQLCLDTNQKLRVNSYVQRIFRLYRLSSYTGCRALGLFSQISP